MLVLMLGNLGRLIGEVSLEKDLVIIFSFVDIFAFNDQEGDVGSHWDCKIICQSINFEVFSRVMSFSLSISLQVIFVAVRDLHDGTS